jgi:hypothetical protein
VQVLTLPKARIPDGEMRVFGKQAIVNDGTFNQA